MNETNESIVQIRAFIEKGCGHHVVAMIGYYENNNPVVQDYVGGHLGAGWQEKYPLATTLLARAIASSIQNQNFDWSITPRWLTNLGVGICRAEAYRFDLLKEAAWILCDQEEIEHAEEEIEADVYTHSLLTWFRDSGPEWVNEALDQGFKCTNDVMKIIATGQWLEKREVLNELYDAMKELVEELEDELDALEDALEEELN